MFSLGSRRNQQMDIWCVQITWTYTRASLACCNIHNPAGQCEFAVVVFSEIVIFNEVWKVIGRFYDNSLVGRGMAQEEFSVRRDLLYSFIRHSIYTLTWFLFSTLNFLQARDLLKIFKIKPTTFINYMSSVEVRRV